MVAAPPGPHRVHELPDHGVHPGGVSNANSQHQVLVLEIEPGLGFHVTGERKLSGRMDVVASQSAVAGGAVVRQAWPRPGTNRANAGATSSLAESTRAWPTAWSRTASWNL